MTQCCNLVAPIVLLAVVAGLSACGSSHGSPPNEPARSESSAPSRPGKPPGASARAPAARSVPDAATADNCDFRVGTTCFANDTEACNAAGCKPGGCIVLESYPAQVTCN